MHWNKSGLQQQLEAEGWHFLTNEYIGNLSTSINGNPTLAELRKGYAELYKAVKLAQAFDGKGNSLHHEEHVAIYVKR